MVKNGIVQQTKYTWRRREWTKILGFSKLVYGKSAVREKCVVLQILRIT
jgi:hypothetical protein